MTLANKNLDILLLEDNPADAEFVQRELRKAGMNFTLRVVDSKEGFANELILSQPDVILSDHSLPSIDSFEALEIANNSNSDIPFILVTGTMTEEFAVECIKAGADDYILKTSLKRLPSSIQQLIAKKEIEHEKKTIEILHLKLQEAYAKIEENHNDITDSITYAKRIQEAILPTIEIFDNCFPNSFIINKPKDIISGDFYWVLEKDGLVFIAVADCTGHGVPGALMSMLGYNMLNGIVNLKNITQPNEILKHLHNGIRKSLKQEGTDYQSHDGMDISLCCFDFAKNKLEFASANQTLYFQSKGEMRIIKGDKYGIAGAYAEPDKSFTLHELAISKGDSIYLSSDGYSDQFGENENRKMKKSSLISILNSIHQMTVVEQKKQLLLKLQEWQGALVQTDDILLIGIKI